MYTDIFNKLSKISHIYLYGITERKIFAADIPSEPGYRLSSSQEGLCSMEFAVIAIIVIVLIILRSYLNEKVAAPV
jgi:hypothetical protein